MSIKIGNMGATNRSLETIKIINHNRYRIRRLRTLSKLNKHFKKRKKLI